MATVVSCFWEITKENHWMPEFNYVFQGVALCMQHLEILHPHYGLLLCLSLVSFSASSFHFSCVFSPSLKTHFHFLLFPFLFFIQQFSADLYVMSLILTPSYFYFCFFYSSAFTHGHSDSFLLCFTLSHGQVARQLAYYIHLSDAVITEETFDLVLQFWRSVGRPQP